MIIKNQATFPIIAFVQVGDAIGSKVTILPRGQADLRGPAGDDSLANVDSDVVCHDAIKTREALHVSLGQPISISPIHDKERRCQIRIRHYRDRPSSAG
ncbi:MAG TPA: hypothetical protein VGP13_02815 [Candidatus Paceibacterota bacterium]|jgi:hypothetical protein|nr:hypothetical protein [Candidatus Paceibacterota bacterium]